MCFFPVTWLPMQNMSFGQKNFIHCAWNSRKKDGMSFLIFSVVSSQFEKLSWTFYWFMYQSGFPGPSSRNLLRGHSIVLQVSTEHSVSKLVSVTQRYVLETTGQNRAQRGKRWTEAASEACLQTLLAFTIDVNWLHLSSLTFLCASLAKLKIAGI